MAARDDLPALRRGTVLKQYSISGRLGGGGQGRLYVAKFHDNRTRQLVAVKVGAPSPLRKEYELLRQFNHPGIPRVYDFFVVGKWGYMVLECIPGPGSLRQRQGVFRDGRLPVEEVLAIGIGLCEILTYLHTRRPPVIHCDIKPENIMQVRTGEIVLIDFGVARALHLDHSKAWIGGTLGYMAPECRDGVATPQTDLYALGATLSTLLKGRSPLEMRDEFGVFRAGWGGLDLLLQSLLATRPAWRPQSAEMTRLALLDIQQSRAWQERFWAWLRGLCRRWSP